MARDNADRAAVESRLDSQLSNEERISRATSVIYNNGDQQKMIEQLEAEWRRSIGGLSFWPVTVRWFTIRGFHIRA